MTVRVQAPVRVAPAWRHGDWDHAAADCWTAFCGPCGNPDDPYVVAASDRLDTPGWTACMTAAWQHVAWHQAGRP